MAEAVQASGGHRQNRGFILGALTFGHGVAHLYDLGFPVFLTAIANTLALSTRETGYLLAIRTSGTGLVSMGSGVLVDRFRGQWGLMLTVCMVLNVIAFCVIGLSPNWGILIIGVVLISIPGSLWHLPAIASLSRRFSDRRAFSISIHSFGSTVGNALGPLVAGTLLLYLIWREVLLLYAIPAGVVAIFVWWSLRDLGREEHQQPGDGEVRTLRTLAGAGLTFFRNPAMLALLVAASFRSIATAAMFDWTPFYLENSPEDGGLGYSYFWTGFQMALLTGTGAISSPILGQLSDKLGRKQILLPCLAVAAVLPLLVIPAGDGYLVPLVMAAIGLFSFALHQVMLAGILDGAARGTEATVAGAVFGINGAVGFASTLLVAYLIDNFGGYGSMYVYVTILTAVAGVIVLLTPFPNYKTQDS
jgi:MFS family permease